jgi:26S proteasome regulatory subunit T5
MNTADGAEEEGANVDLNDIRVGKSAVIKTSTRQTIFLPIIGLVDPEKLKPADLIGLNKDSYLVLDTLPAEYDSRVKAMEVDEKPTEVYGDIGGLNQQIEELVEAVVLPMQQQEKFKTLGIKPPKGITFDKIWLTIGALMYGPPGTGKTLLARACAAQSKATFLKLAGPQLVQVFFSLQRSVLIGDVHWRWSKVSSRCIRSSKRKGTRHNLHRRTRRNWYKTI